MYRVFERAGVGSLALTAGRPYTCNERALTMVGRNASSLRSLNHEFSRSYPNNDVRNTSGFTKPPRNVRPVVALVSHTSAGLNSLGSIL